MIIVGPEEHCQKAAGGFGEPQGMLDEFLRLGVGRAGDDRIGAAPNRALHEEVDALDYVRTFDLKASRAERADHLSQSRRGLPDAPNRTQVRNQRRRHPRRGFIKIPLLACVTAIALARFFVPNKLATVITPSFEPLPRCHRTISMGYFVWNRYLLVYGSGLVSIEAIDLVGG